MANTIDNARDPSESVTKTSHVVRYFGEIPIHHLPGSTPQWESYDIGQALGFSKSGRNFHNLLHSLWLGIINNPEMALVLDPRRVKHGVLLSPRGIRNILLKCLETRHDRVRDYVLWHNTNYTNFQITDLPIRPTPRLLEPKAEPSILGSYRKLDEQLTKLVLRYDALQEKVSDQEDRIHSLEAMVSKIRGLRIDTAGKRARDRVSAATPNLDPPDEGEGVN